MRMWELIEGRWDDDFFKNYSLIVLVNSMKPKEILVRFNQTLVVHTGTAISCSCPDGLEGCDEHCACHYLFNEMPRSYSRVCFIQIRKHDIRHVIWLDILLFSQQVC